MESPGHRHILVCPVDHHKLNLQGDELICEQCGRAYPVRDGIPVMLKVEARMTKAVSSDGSDRTPGAAAAAEPGRGRGAQARGPPTIFIGQL